MQLRADIQIRSMIKSLNDVVLPAIDPGNKPAQEQAQLIAAMLGILERRAPLQYRFDRDELARLLGFARELGAAAGADMAATLDAAAAEAAAVLERALQVEPAAVLDAVRQLRALTAAAVQAAFASGDAVAREALRGQVLAYAGEQLVRDRAWLVDQGWEPDASGMPPIEGLLR